MTTISVDGISTVDLGNWDALTELFPSFNAIEEIKVSETLNPAEYGGVADVTTVSKSGTNTFHGGAFENFQNSDLNASDTFSHKVTPVKLNDFGVFAGGPIVRNKTFFFASGEDPAIAQESNEHHHRSHRRDAERGSFGLSQSEPGRVT